MKIAIMTQPLGKNYGGMIQAWALQQVLKNAGHTPVTIDRQYEEKNAIYHAARLGKRTLQKVIGRWKAPINFERHLPSILLHTHTFIDQHLSMSEPLNSTDKLREHFEREQYDAVIVGSDQTWRPQYSPNIHNYFLDFLTDSDIKRIAYASSFGVDEWEFSDEQTRLCAALATRFDSISVRERSGVELCEKYLRVTASHVLDPTLLLGKESYEALYSNKEIPRRQGIYTYILDEAEWKNQVLHTAKQMLGMEHYNNQPKVSMSSMSSNSPLDYTMPSLESWIKGFADAEFVITDSFHGTVFSILFNKPFISLVNPGRGSTRFNSLCEKLGLSSQLLKVYSESSVRDLVNGHINHCGVGDKLDGLKKESVFFLNETIKDNTC